MEDGFFEHYFEQDGVHIKYARSFPSVSGQEFHNYCEFVFFLGGKARFISKSFNRELCEGNLIFIPKNAYHQFVTEGGDYKRLILGFRATSELEPLLSALSNDAMLIEKQSDVTKVMLDGLIGASTSEMTNNEKRLFLGSVIVQLLFELRKEGLGQTPSNLKVSKSVSDALLLIDESYSSDITVESLASRLHISTSLLSHKFKEEMQISVYKYVLKKRLSVARELVESGISVTAAATKSGFSDYSCFLRAYKKYYGELPSKKSLPFDR